MATSGVEVGDDAERVEPLDVVGVRERDLVGSCLPAELRLYVLDGFEHDADGRVPFGVKMHVEASAMRGRRPVAEEAHDLNPSLHRRSSLAQKTTRPLNPKNSAVE